MNPFIVYLDQNHWIHLSQDYYQRSKSTDESYQELIEKIRLAVNQNRAIFPVSIFHAVEMLLANDISRRERLFQFVAEISHGWITAPTWEIVPLELEILISGKPNRVSAFKKLDSLEALHDHLFPVEENKESAKRYKERTTEYAQRIERARIRKDGKPYSREALRFFYARNLIPDIREELFNFSQEYEIDVDAFVEKLGLFENIPVLDVQLTLTTERERNLNKPVSPNDIVDLSHLSVAIPYCDIVIPDSYWASLAKIERLGLEEKYSVKILEKLSQLENYL